MTAFSFAGGIALVVTVITRNAPLLFAFRFPSVVLHYHNKHHHSITLSFPLPSLVQT